MNEQARNEQIFSGLRAFLLAFVIFGVTPSGATDGQNASLDTEVQDLKNSVLDLNRELFMLEEELLDGKSVGNYLYTEREVASLHRGGVQRLFVGNLKTGSHELVAIFTGVGPHGRDYRRGATLDFEKSIGAKFVELQISDRVTKQQPEFVVREWE
jgi:hypothetical protein